VDKLVNIQRRFLWGGGRKQRKIVWVNWETVYLPKDKGGLGIRDLRTFNTTLLGKWRWELFQNQGEMWSRILISKYGGWRSLDEKRRSSYHSPWWKDLMSINQQRDSIVLRNQIDWRVGCGDKFRFWEDSWAGNDKTLMAKYPRLYQVSNQQQQTINCMGGHNAVG